jgi:hypothetical protein
MAANRFCEHQGIGHARFRRINSTMVEKRGDTNGPIAGQQNEWERHTQRKGSRKWNK